MAPRKLDSRTIDIDATLLRKMYITEKMTIKQISIALGYSVTPVWRSLKRHNIKLQPAGGQYTYQEKGITPKVLKRLYIKRQLPIIDICKIFDCRYETVRRALVHFDIPIRTQSESNKLSAQKRIWADSGHGRNWRGGISKNDKGYALKWAPDHPRSHNRGYVYEHILVWENTYGKPVPKDYHVHHLNGIKTDNRPINLHAIPNSEHANLAGPYKARIRVLEAEIKGLRQQGMTLGD